MTNEEFLRQRVHDAYEYISWLKFLINEAGVDPFDGLETLTLPPHLNAEIIDELDAIQAPSLATLNHKSAKRVDFKGLQSR